jgi:hypothetical protein
LGLGVVDLADNLVVFGIEFDAGHKTRFPGTVPGKPENRDRVIVPCELQVGGRQTLVQCPTEGFPRMGFQAVNEYVGGYGDVAHRERYRSAVK